VVCNRSAAHNNCMSSQVLEIETKYDVDDAAVLPPLDQLPCVGSVAEPEQQVLVATYHDTPQLDLLHAGIALRRRTGGGDAGWHLKLPAGPDRLELHAPLNDSETEVPESFRDIVQAVVRDRALVEVARIETHRTVTLLRDVDHNALAEVCDDRVAATRLGTEQKEEQDSWREWELELRKPDSEIAREGRRALISSGARPSRSASKLARVLAIPGGLHAPAKTRKSPRAGTSVADVVGEHLARHVAELRRLDPLARADVPDAVHRLRVECRRLRGAFASFRSFFDAGISDSLRPELKWLIDELGRPRDLEVLKRRIETLLEEETGPDATAGPQITHVLGEEHRLAHHQAVEAMADPRYFALIDALQAIVDNAPWSARAHRSARKELPKVVRKEWQRVSTAADVARHASPDVLAARLHHVRKAAKRARYAAEAIEPVVGKDATRFAHAMTELQDTLGEHHDTVVARQKVVELSSSSSSEDPARPEFERLLGRLADTGREAQESYGRALSRASRPKRLRWLG
jgi:CHAD domain-containing protein